MPMTRSRWFLPLFALALGVAMLIAQSLGGHLGQGLISLAIMGVFGLAVLLGGRSETIRGLRGDGRDERFAQMDVRATALAGGVLILTVIVAFMVEVARGHSGAPYFWLGAIAGVAYLVGLAWYRIRE